jgi:hypothetical protein
MNPDEFLQLARTLLGQGGTLDPTSEAYARSAVSRAYYALFHESLAHLIANHNSELVASINENLARERTPTIGPDPITFDDLDMIEDQLHPQMHWVVAKALGLVDSASSLNFKGFRKDRNEADYQLNKQLAQSKAITKLMAIDFLISQIKMI